MSCRAVELFVHAVGGCSYAQSCNSKLHSNFASFNRYHLSKAAAAVLHLRIYYTTRSAHWSPHRQFVNPKGEKSPNGSQEQASKKGSEIQEEAGAN